MDSSVIKVKAVIRKFARQGFGYELFISSLPWEIKAGGPEYRERPISALIGYRSVIGVIKAVKSCNSEYHIEIHKNVRAQLNFELSTEFF